jgi:hypothetical protein
MRNLAQGVDAGVGSAGGVNRQTLFGDFLDDFCECGLNGGLAGLGLPAAEIGSVVGQGEFDRLHFGELSHGGVRAEERG